MGWWEGRASDDGGEIDLLSSSNQQYQHSKRKKSLEVIFVRYKVSLLLLLMLLLLLVVYTPESKCLMKCGNKIEKQSQRKLNEANFLHPPLEQLSENFPFFCVFTRHIFRVGRKSFCLFFFVFDLRVFASELKNFLSIFLNQFFFSHSR